MNTFKVTGTTSQIPLGRQGENAARRIQFNLSSWQMAFGDGFPKLIHKRAGDSIAYLVPLEVDGAAAYWNVSRVDTENPGAGKCELSYYVGDVIVKSVMYSTKVEASMNEEVGYEPEDVPDWLDAVNAAIANSDAAAERAQEAAKAAQDAAKTANDAAENAGSGSGDGEIPSDSVATDEEADEMLNEIFEEGPASENS